MTPEEKQSELRRHRDILLATFDYFIDRSKGMNFDNFDPTAHYQQLKVQTEENYQKGRLTRLKQWLRDMTEEAKETGDLSFERFIKEKTGYDTDINGRFQRRIDHVINRKRINTENEYRDVLAMVDTLSQQDLVEYNKIEILNILLKEFDSRKGTMQNG